MRPAGRIEEGHRRGEQIKARREQPGRGISGHCHAYATLCPGAALHSALPEIRGAAGASVYAGRPGK
ncbi:hypothetical protein GCM10010469_54970 [Streptomyces labedae]|uniref:Uncharacterized protein n=1 Tax=Streptomyces labedae TaxID=285569 RepID=A0ABP6R7P5_9ACTN